MDILTLLILIMATWRISSLLVNEEGPFGALAELRFIVSKFSEVLSCLWCASIWVALAIAICYAWWPQMTTLVMLPFALSTGAIAWDKHNG